MNAKLPSFVIIGAMKCATTSLYDQLKEQPGIFMPELKEPNYFSDDDVFAEGDQWYRSLFSGAADGDMCGEASTHYTKLPTYPKTVSRISSALGTPKLIYVIRHPIERVVSQYIHEWSQGIVRSPINEAIDNHPELVEYSRYATQLEPFANTFGRENILVIHFEHIKQAPEDVLKKVCDFIGYQGTPHWQFERAPSNVSSERIRRFPMDEFILQNPVLRFMRRSLVSKNFRDWIKARLSMRKRPQLNEKSIAKLTEIFDADLQNLQSYLGYRLTCENYHETVRQCVVVAQNEGATDGKLHEVTQ